jgi:hypothetical protein
MELLQQLLERDGATLLGDYVKTTSETPIEFRCSCGSVAIRKFGYMVRVSGVFCGVCTEKRRQIRIKETNLQRYGGHPAKTESSKQKTVETNMRKYGLPSHNQSDRVKAKKVETYRSTLGVDNPAQSDTVKAKAKATNIKVYGFENPFQNEEIKAKIRDEMKTRYGVENPSQLAEFQAKKVETMLERFGVPYAMQNPTIFERSQNHSHRSKDYRMPSGEIRRVRGYEPRALDKLLETFSEAQIVTRAGHVPHPKYFDPIASKTRTYYPDIFIPHENRVIEVKSNYYYKRDKTVNLCKAEAIRQLGFRFEFWVFDKNGNRVDPETIV